MDKKVLFLVVLGAGLLAVLALFFMTRSDDEVPVDENTQIETQKPLPKPEMELDEDEDEQDENELEGEQNDSEDEDEEGVDTQDEQEDAGDEQATPEDTTTPVDTSDEQESTDAGSDTTDVPQDPVDDTSSTGSSSSTPTDDNVDTSIAGRIETERLTHYYNGALKYGLLVPRNNYYSGFGPQGDARHSVGFNTEGIPDTLEDTQVRVYFYGSTELPELASENFYQDPDTGDTFLKLDDQYVRIESEDLDSETLQMIIETIYIGENQAPEPVEEDEMDTQSETQG